MKSNDVQRSLAHSDGSTLGYSDATTLPPDLLDITIDEMGEKVQFNQTINVSITVDTPPWIGR